VIRDFQKTRETKGDWFLEGKPYLFQQLGGNADFNGLPSNNHILHIERAPFTLKQGRTNELFGRTAPRRSKILRYRKPPFDGTNSSVS